MKEKRLRDINRIIFVLSLLGIAVAAYVTQSWLRHSTILCLTNGCEAVRKNSASYIFGIPVPMFGLIGYALLAIFAFVRTSQLKPQTSMIFLKLMLVVSIFGVVFISWFTYTELFVIHAICTWCAVSAVNMVAIFLLVLSSYKRYETHK